MGQNEGFLCECYAKLAFSVSSREQHAHEHMFARMENDTRVCRTPTKKDGCLSYHNSDFPETSRVSRLQLHQICSGKPSRSLLENNPQKKDI